MGRLRLTETQAGRVAQGLCACPCGRALPATRDPSRVFARVDTAACRQAAHRERKAEGAAIPAHVRLQAAAREDAARCEDEIVELDREIRALQARRAELVTRRDDARRRADGQLSLVLSSSPPVERHALPPGSSPVELPVAESPAALLGLLARRGAVACMDGMVRPCTGKRRLADPVGRWARADLEALVAVQAVRWQSALNAFSMQGAQGFALLREVDPRGGGLSPETTRALDAMIQGRVSARRQTA